ncbi:ABC transporter permease [Rubrolithibacter danxiaensis]|uniref:ABC transporter permease n=1 Tax=Rubrolithibacter danxiaensis TaxID=3390805 RepID=UPI003BF8EE19
MLKNYLKIALAVLQRRKFFTFISLFGISFTLTILILLSSFADHAISTSYPELNKDRSLYITTLQQLNTKKFGMMQGPGSFYFMDHYAGSLKTPEKVGISSMFIATNTYVNNKKFVINVKYTNEAFWDVISYDFIEGKPYTKQQIANGEKIAVITDDTKREYFGDVKNAVGKYIETDNVQYRVVGVVKASPVTMIYSYADMFLPYTISKADYRNKGYMGNYVAVLLAKSKDDLPKIQEEFASVVSKIPPENPKDFDEFHSSADPYLATFTRIIFGDGNNSGITKFGITIFLFVLLIMLLPTINLVNINISRIMERSSEIAVRKAFGASSGTLVIQFIVENIILTLLGGLIGLAFAGVVIHFVNESQLIQNANFGIDLSVFAYTILASLFFGLLSGVYPAWRMSRLHVVKALKAQ